MTITLISFYFVNPGIRYLSAYLKRSGYKVNIVFLLPEEMYSIDYRYPEKLLENLKETCKDSSIIGLSVLTNDCYRAIQVTKFLKKETNALIFWGGIHPTIYPASAPREVDYIYIGEGEKGFLEAVQTLEKGKDISNIENLAYWKDNVLYKNKLRPLLRDTELDHFQDFDYEQHYINSNDKIIPVTEKILKEKILKDFEFDDYTYLTIFTRGCIHGCAYCCNNKLNSLYHFEKAKYRKKSISSLIDELKYILKKFRFVKYILFLDDNFLVNDIETLKQFAERYKKEVNLPFTVYGSPVFVNEEKLSVLCESGLREVHIGIQSGSERINYEIYKRRIPGKSVINAAKLIKKFALRGRYDLIFDNPYEDVEDQVRTAKLLLELPKPYILQPFSLTFFPGTELYDRAKKDGKLYSEKHQTYERKTNAFFEEDVTYLKLICVLIPRLPTGIGKLLISRPLVFLFHRDYLKGIYGTLYKLLQVIKNVFGLSVKILYR